LGGLTGLLFIKSNILLNFYLNLLSGVTNSPSPQVITPKISDIKLPKGFIIEVPANGNPNNGGSGDDSSDDSSDDSNYYDCVCRNPNRRISDDDCDKICQNPNCRKYNRSRWDSDDEGFCN